jgi:WD40-like Beta Propeller Repeat
LESARPINTRRGARVKGGYRTAGCQRTSTIQPARLITGPLVLLTLLLAVACGKLSDSVAGVSESEPVWMPDGWVYYLREVASEGAELWRQRDDQDADQPVLDLEDVRGICNRAALGFLFLFRATEEDLGIGVECAGAGTKSMAFSPGRRSFSPMDSRLPVGGVPLAMGKAGKGTGYVQLATACGLAIKPIQDGVVREFASPITVAGRSWKLSGAESSDCASAALVRSPALGPDGSLCFLAAPDSIGKLPITDPRAPDGFQWYLCSWDGRSAAPRVVTRLRGLADMTVSPDGRVAVVALSTPGVEGVVIVDTATGRTTEATKGRKASNPSFSPDGRRYVYVEDYRRLRFGSLPA